MGGRADSENVKARAEYADQDQRLRMAVEVLNASPHRSIREVAHEFQVPNTTLQHRIQGHRSQSEYMQSLQKLSPIVEEELVNYALQRAACSTPMTHGELHQHATSLLNRGKKGPKKLGKKWSQNFVSRHKKQLSTYWSSPLDNNRAGAVTGQALSSHFGLVGESTEKYDIIPENDYGMDETCILLGYTGPRRVIGPAGAKTQHSRQDGSRESITVIEAVCCDGTTVRPTVIFAGKYLLKEWGTRENNPIGAHICVSPKGYTDEELGLKWIQQFDEQTSGKANGRYRRLFVDNHGSHCTPAFLQYAASKKIVVIGYPPHCTHVLQGLDVACFGRLKTVWTEERTRIEQEEGGKVTKSDFIRLYARVRERAMLPSTIFSAFRKTGIYPFNPNVVTAAQIAPSLCLSTETGLPFELPASTSLITQAIREDVQRRGQTAPVSEESQTTTGTQGVSTLATSIVRTLEATPYAPLVSSDLSTFSSSTPTPSIIPSYSGASDDLPIDPTLRAICNSATPAAPGDDGQALADDVARLEKENRQLREQNLRYEAQIILQDLYVAKAQKKLYIKENRKRTTREILACAGRREMTSPEWLAFLEEEDAEARRLLELKDRKAAWIETEREERRAGYEAAVEEWQQTKAACRANKTRAPKKPTAPKKAPNPEWFEELLPKNIPTPIKKLMKKIRKEQDDSDEENDMDIDADD